MMTRRRPSVTLLLLSDHDPTLVSGTDYAADYLIIQDFDDVQIHRTDAGMPIMKDKTRI